MQGKVDGVKSRGEEVFVYIIIIKIRMLIITLSWL